MRYLRIRNLNITFVIDKDGTGVRIDDGVREGDVISPFYDSMIAKLIVHAPTREQALAKLDRALAQTRIVGLPNDGCLCVKYRVF